MSSHVQCRMCEFQYSVLLRRCPECNVTNQLFQGDPPFVIQLELEPEIQKSLYVISKERKRSIPSLIVEAIENYLSVRKK